jgi:hypothetical protein
LQFNYDNYYTSKKVICLAFYAQRFLKKTNAMDSTKANLRANNCVLMSPIKDSCIQKLSENIIVNCLEEHRERLALKPDTNFEINAFGHLNVDYKDKWSEKNSEKQKNDQETYSNA